MLKELIYPNSNTMNKVEAEWKKGWDAMKPTLPGLSQSASTNKAKSQINVPLRSQKERLLMELDKGVGGSGKSLDENRDEIAYDLIKGLNEAGITNKDAQLNILANIQHESAFDYQKHENMKYGADALIQVRHDNFKAVRQVVGKDKIGKNITKWVAPPEEYKRAEQISKKGPLSVAQFMYGNGAMGNGNELDAALYRGRGLVQLTGKSAYQNFQKYLDSKGIKADVINNPELVNRDKNIAVQSVIFHFLQKAPVEKLNTAGRDIAQMTRWVGPANIEEKIAQRRATVEKAKAKGIYEPYYNKLKQSQTQKAGLDALLTGGDTNV